MEELKYGIPISKLDVVSNIMKKILIQYPFPLMVNIWLLLEEERL